LQATFVQGFFTTLRSPLQVCIAPTCVGGAAGMSIPENRMKTGTLRQLPEAAKPYQFKAGQSGNPGGRPSYRKLTEALERELAKRATKGSGTREDQVASTLVSLALRGDVQALRLIFERCEGKPLQPIQLDGTMNVTPGDPKLRARQLIDAAIGRQKG
jgi:hypothetical protein